MFWVGSWLVLSGSLTRFKDWTHGEFLEASAGMGFTVRNILVEGRGHTDPDTIRGIVTVNKGDPLFSFDPDAAQAMLEKVSWVRTAQVERRLPDTIYIHLEERVPLALWQYQGKVWVIDGEGAVLTDEKAADFSHLTIVVGEDAPKQAEALLAMLSAEPDIMKRTEAATYVAGRRWDLTFKNGAEVHLPAEDLGLALRRLAAAQDEDGLLDKDLKAIDVREAGRITVRTQPGAVMEYKAALEAGGPGGNI